jgi:shikimate dehydrogenase
MHLMPGRRAAVLGRPIGHSRSPLLHTAAYHALGLSDWTYEAIDCAAEDIAALLARSGPEWAGFSVTMPVKRAALQQADHVAPTAALVGAANTLLRGVDGSWTADNTDVIGILSSLRAVTFTHETAAIIGAGGTAQAAVVALGRLGLTQVDVIVREPARTIELARTAHRVGVALSVYRIEDAGPVFDRAGIVVSTLPAHAADGMADRAWPASTVLLDAVYQPRSTALLEAVHSRGGITIGGAEILLHQAAAQVHLMTGRAAPVEAMRVALDADLAH